MEAVRVQDMLERSGWKGECTGEAEMRLLVIQNPEWLVLLEPTERRAEGISLTQAAWDMDDDRFDALLAYLATIRDRAGLERSRAQR